MTGYREELEVVLEALESSVERIGAYSAPEEQALKPGKKGMEIVTEADSEIESLIRSRLSERFPDYGFVAEESDNVERTDNWIVDPIDGTSGFSRGRNYYCVSIALEEDGETVVGAVSAPEFRGGITGLAVKDEGAYSFSNDDFGSEVEELMAEDNRLRMDEISGLEGSVGMVEASSVDSVETRMSDIRKDMEATYVQPGSAALELLEMARGALDFRIDTIKPWDYAAGHLIVEEAGGRIYESTFRPDELEEELDLAVASKQGALPELLQKAKESGFPVEVGK